MTDEYSFKKIDHRQGGNSGEIISSITGSFDNRRDGLRNVKILAREVSELILSLDDFQQQGCNAVCPACTEVCCINRHAYHEHEDVIYLFALGEELPSYNLDVIDTGPCQFLGETGCTIKRHLRPHRCNAYFCTPLLEYMQERPAPAYRRFVNDLELLTRKREEMLEAFING
jgi:hypothetical protein